MTECLRDKQKGIFGLVVVSVIVMIMRLWCSVSRRRGSDFHYVAVQKQISFYDKFMAWREERFPFTGWHFIYSSEETFTEGSATIIPGMDPKGVVDLKGTLFHLVNSLSGGVSGSGN